MSASIDPETQKSEFRRALDIIKNIFPKDTALSADEFKFRRQLIEKELAPAMLGEAPEWTLPAGYRLGRGAIFNSGAFCVYWHKDPNRDDIETIVHVRKEKNNNPSHPHKF